MARYYVQYIIWALVVVVGALGLKSLDANDELSLWDFVYTAILFLGIVMECRAINSYRRAKKNQSSKEEKGGLE